MASSEGSIPIRSKSRSRIDPNRRLWKIQGLNRVSLDRICVPNSFRICSSVGVYGGPDPNRALPNSRCVQSVLSLSSTTFCLFPCHHLSSSHGQSRYPNSSSLADHRLHCSHRNKPVRHIDRCGRCPVRLCTQGRCHCPYRPLYHSFSGRTPKLDPEVASLHVPLRSITFKLHRPPLTLSHSSL